MIKQLYSQRTFTSLYFTGVRKFVVILPALILGTVSAQAASDTWVGNSSANWSTGGWTGGNNPPTGGDTLFFGTAGSAGTTLNNDLTAGTSFGGITFNAGASAYTIGGNSIALTGGITNSSTSLETINLAIATTAAQTITLTSGGGNIALGGIISGTNGGLTLAGTGTLTLSGANTYTGPTQIGSGTQLNFNNATAIGTGTLTISGGGAIDNTSGSTVVNSKNNVQIWNGNFTYGGTNTLNMGTGAITLGANVAIANSGTGTLTEGGVITGAYNLNLEPNAAGAIIVTDANNGGTITDSGGGAGTLTVSTIGSNVTGVIENSTTSGINGSTLTVNSGGTTLTNSAGTKLITISNINGTGNLVLDNDSAVLNGISLTANTNFTGTLTNSGTGSGNTLVSLIEANVEAVIENSANSTLTIGGANTFAGNVSIINGEVSGSGTVTPFGSGSILLGDTTPSNAHNATLLYTGTSTAVSNPITVEAGSSGVLTIEGQTKSNAFTGAITLNNNLSLAELTTGSTTTFSGPITGSSTITIASGNLGIVALSGANGSSYTGNVVVNAGTLNFTSGALGNGAGSITFGGGTLQYASGNTQDISSRIANTGSTVKIDVNGNALNFGTALGSGITGGLTLSSTAGGGSLVLNGSQGYTGLTTVSAGTLQLGASSSLASGNALTTSSGATFDLNGNSQTLGLVNISGTITNSSATPVTLTIGAGSTGTGAFSGAMNLIWNQGGGTTTTLGGSISGMTGNLTLNPTNNVPTPFTTVDNVGTVTDSGTGTGQASITTLGGNVTAVNENSTTSGVAITNLDLNLGGTTLTNTSSAKAITVTNLATGTGNLILDNNGTGASAITFTAGANNTGTITNAGTGTGTTTLGSLGGNVAAVTQNSSGSVLYINGASPSYSGSTTLDAGILKFVTGGLGTGTITFAGGTLQYGTANTQDVSSLIANTSSPINLDVNGNAVVFATALGSGNTGGLTLSSTATGGSLTLTGAQGYTGATTIYSGTLSLAASSSLASGNSLVVASGAGFNVNGNTQGLGQVINNGTFASTSGTANVTIGNGSTGVGAYTGTMNLTWNQGAASSSISGSVAGMTGNIVLNANGAGSVGLNNVNNIGTLTNSGSGTGTTTIGGAIGANVTGVIENSANSGLVLAGNSSFTGGLSILSGTVTATTSVNALGGAGTGTVTLGNTTGSNAATVLGGLNSASYSNPIVLATNAGVGLLTIGNAGAGVTVSFNGGVTGNNSFVTNDSVGAAGLNFGGASMNNAGTITNAGAGTGTVAISSVIGTNVTGVIQNSATSQLNLTGANTFTGGLSIQNGTVYIGVGNVGSTSGGAGPSTSAITLGAMGGSNSASLITSSFTVSNPINLGGTTGTLSIGDTGAGGASFSGAIALDGNNLTLAAVGSGDVNITGGITGTGNLILSNNTSNGAGVNLTTTTINNTGTITNIGTSGAATIGAALGGNVANVTEDSSASPLTLSGANTSFGGTVTVDLGTLKFGSSGALNANNVVTVYNGGTVDLGGNNVTIAGLNDGSAGTGESLTNSVASLRALTFGGSGSYSFGGVISGADTGITMNGTGTQTLSGANTYGNTTTVTAGTLDFTGSNTMAGAIVVNGGTLNFTGNNAMTGATTVSGGTLLLSGNNTNSGPVTVNGGTLDINASGTSSSNSALGTGTLNISSGTIDNTGSSPVTVATNNAETWGTAFTYGGTQNLNLGTGAISDGHGGTVITLDGSGSTLTFGGVLTNVVGATQVITVNGTGNTLNLGGYVLSGTAGVGRNVTINGGAYVNVTGPITDTVSGTAVSNLIYDGSGTLTLSGVNTYSGATTVSSGRVNINGSNNGAGTISVSSGATLGGTGSIAGNVSVASGANINTQDGVIGTLTVGGLSIGNATTKSSISLDIQTVSGTTSVDSIADNGALTLTGAAGTTINIASLAGTSTLTDGVYTLISYTGSYTGSLSNLSLSTTSLDGRTLSLTQGTGQIDLTIAGGVTTTSTTYTLTTTAGSSRLLSGQSTSLTTTITNTGSGTADTLDYSGLGVSATGVSGSTSSGTALAQGATGTNTVQTFTGSTTGTIALAPSVGTATNTTIGGNATLTSTGTATVDVVDKRTITNGATTDLGTLHSGATVSAAANTFNSSGTNATTTSVSVAGGTGSADGNGVTLTGGSTTFNGATSGTVNGSTQTLGGTITNATGGTTTGSFSLGVTTLENGGAGLTGEGSYTPVNVGYTAFVYTGVGVWNTNGGGTWGAVSSSPANWTANGGTPGITAGFANTDSASFGGVLTSGTGTVTLDGENPSLNAITFDDSSASYLLAQGTGTGSITLDGNGGNANVTDVAGTHEISAPIDLATSANVDVASGQQLTMSGTISGTGGLVNNGSGTTILSGSNGYSGGTTVSSGVLQLSNGSGSATGSGALSVGAGATLAGSGLSSGSSFSITGSSSTVATVLVGHNNAGDINTMGVMSLQATGASSIGSAKLVFNLNSNVAGQGNQLSVGTTAITFNTVGSLNTTLTLNVEGNTYIAGYTSYVLVAGTGTTIIGDGGATSGQYSGLTTFLNSRGQEQIVTGPTSNLQLSFSSPTQAGYYAPSYLFLVNNDGVDDIEVEVVPEPGTWAMMLGGLGLLVLIQRRRRS